MSTPFIYFTDIQKEQARKTDLVSFLKMQGESLKSSGSEYEWQSPSGKVTVRGNLWYHQYEQEGGDAIAFVQKFFGKSYPDAVNLLIGGNAVCLSSEKQKVKKQSTETLTLPKRNENMRRVFAYLLNRRCLDRSVVYAFAHRDMIYESDPYHNVVFVGFDNDGTPRHANKRGTGRESTFKGNEPGSIPEYSFHWNGSDNELYFFEAPIDMLSYISMHPNKWIHHSYAAACSGSDRVLMQMLKDNPKIDTVFLCLDSDGPGQNAAKRIADKLFVMGIKHKILLPINKDWNEDLIQLSTESEEEPCPVMQFS